MVPYGAGANRVSEAAQNDEARARAQPRTRAINRRV